MPTTVCFLYISSYNLFLNPSKEISRFSISIKIILTFVPSPDSNKISECSLILSFNGKSNQTSDALYFLNMHTFDTCHFEKYRNYFFYFYLCFFILYPL